MFRFWSLDGFSESSDDVEKFPRLEKSNIEITIIIRMWVTVLDGLIKGCDVIIKIYSIYSRKNLRFYGVNKL